MSCGERFEFMIVAFLCTTDFLVMHDVSKILISYLFQNNDHYQWCVQCISGILQSSKSSLLHVLASASWHLYWLYWFLNIRSTISYDHIFWLKQVQQSKFFFNLMIRNAATPGIRYKAYQSRWSKFIRPEVCWHSTSSQRQILQHFSIEFWPFW